MQMARAPGGTPPSTEAAHGCGPARETDPAVPRRLQPGRARTRWIPAGKAHRAADRRQVDRRGDRAPPGRQRDDERDPAPEAARRAVPGDPGLRPGPLRRGDALPGAADRALAAGVPLRARVHVPALRPHDRGRLAETRLAQRGRELPQRDLARHLRQARPRPRRADRTAEGGAQEVIWRCRDVTFDLTDRVLVMGIVNVTPDSFSDGGRYLDPGLAVARCHELLAEGADLLDLGGESTRPGSAEVTASEQWRRLEPVLTQVARARPHAVLSVDTRSAEVAGLALAAGARIVNDVSALS